jgi:PAS domain S-box-containing protein
MKDLSMANQKLSEEITSLKDRIKELEQSEVDHIQREEALRVSKNLYQRLIENARDMLYRMSLPFGKYEYISPACYDITGFTPEECYNGTISIAKIIHPDFSEYFNQQWINLLQGKVPPFYEYKIIRKNGGERWLHQRNILIRDENGLPVAIEGMVRDITEHKCAEEEMRENEKNYQDIFQNSIEGIFRTSPEGRFIYANPAAARMLGYESPEDLISTVTDMGTQLYVYPEDREKVIGLLTKYGSIKNFAVQCHHKDGSIIWGTLNMHIKQDDQENILYIEGTCQDITKYKLTAEALRNSEEKYRQLVDSINKGICVAQDGMLKYVNPMLMEIFGYSKHDLTTLPFTEFIHPDDRNMVLERHKRRVKGENFSTRYEFRILAKDGSIKWVELDSVMVDWEDKTAVLAFVGDINERKKAEEELEKYRNHLEYLVEKRTGQLKRSENKYRTLFENSNDAIILIRQGVFIDCNAKTLELCRCTREQIIGKAPYEFAPPFQPDGSNSREKANEKMDAAASGTPQRFEWQACRSDGTAFDTEVDMQVIEVGKERLLQGIVHDITKRKQKENELQIKAADLEELNTTLKVLLHQREEDRKDLEERFAVNLKSFVLPYVEKMKKGHLDPNQRSYLNIIETNLNEIVSPFLHTIRFLNLTPRETQVAALIRESKTTKEIAQIIGVGLDAIDAYRKSIRKKLKLNDRKINLQSYLRSLDK